MNEWMIAAIALALMLAASGIACFRIKKAHAAECEQLRQEEDRLRGENIGLRRELAALERDLEDEQAHSDDLDLEIERLHGELAQAAERVQRAETRRTDAEKEMFATRMRIDQLQQQLRQSHEEQINQERLYQDIIEERDRTIIELQDKLHRRRKKKKRESALEQQITLDDILKGGGE